MALPVTLLFKALSRDYGVGSIKFDLLLTENHRFSSEASVHPIEDGSEISDHIQNELEQGSFTGLISNYSLKTPFIVSNKAQDVFDAFISLRDQKVLSTVYTVMRTYDNMAILDISVGKDSEIVEGAIFEITFRQLKVVKLQEIDIELSVKPKDLTTNTSRQVSPNKNAGRTVSTLSTRTIAG